MRTARVLTVSPSMLCAGGCILWGGVPGPREGVYLVPGRGVYLVPGGVPGPRGVSALEGVPGPGVSTLGGVCTWSWGCTWSQGRGCLLWGDVCSGECLLWGVSALGGAPGPRGWLLPGVICSWGGEPAPRGLSALKECVLGPRGVSTLRGVPGPGGVNLVPGGCLLQGVYLV